MESSKKDVVSLTSIHKLKEQLRMEKEIIKIKEQILYDAEIALRKKSMASSSKHHVPANNKESGVKSVVVKCYKTTQSSSTSDVKVLDDRVKSSKPKSVVKCNQTSQSSSKPNQVENFRVKSLKHTSVDIKCNQTSQSSSKTNQVDQVDRVKNKGKPNVPPTIKLSEIEFWEPISVVINQTSDFSTKQTKSSIEVCSTTNQIEDDKVKIHNKRVQAKQEKKKQRKIRIQGLRDQIAVLQKNKTDKMNCQILQELTNEFPESHLKMAEPEVNRIPVKSLLQDGNFTAKVDEKLKQQELEYYQSLPPPPPPPGKPGKHLPQPVEKNPQKDIRMYFHFNPILDSYVTTFSPIPPEYLRK